MSEKKTTPRFYIIRILLAAFFIYLFLVLPVSISLVFRSLPAMAMNNPNLTIMVQDSIAQIASQDSSVIPGSATAIEDTVKALKTPATEKSSFVAEFNPLWVLSPLFLALLVILVINLPFRVYFNRCRKNRKATYKMTEYCKKHIYRTPLYFGLISFAAFLLGNLIMLIIFFTKDFKSAAEQNLFIELMAISLLAGILTSVFIYSWQKHRVSLLYIEHIFPPQELQRISTRTTYSKIKNQLWMSGLMTSILPLVFVIIYLLLSWSTVSGNQIHSVGELKLLLGNYGQVFDMIEGGSLKDMLKWLNTNNITLYYTDLPSWVILNAGVVISSLVTLFYLLMYIRWTTEIIVFPVRELLENMQRTGHGQFGLVNPVRTNDEIGQLTEGFNNMSRELDTYITHISEQNQAYYRFVPRQLTDFIGKKDFKDIVLGDQIQKEMTVLFCDIKDFTALSENLTPEENISFLNQYLCYMEPVISGNHGFIDKYIGDAIMAIFPEKPEHAITASLEMHRKLREFNRQRTKEFKPEIGIGIGINTGLVMFGVVGSPDRLNATVISDAVNLAYRLEGLTRIYPARVLISAETVRRLSDSAFFEFRQIDVVRVKGKKEAVGIYELLDCYTDDVKANLIMNRADFEQATNLLRQKKFEDALNLFKQILNLNPDDQITQIYADRCTDYARYGIPAGWDGIEDMKQK